MTKLISAPALLMPEETIERLRIATAKRRAKHFPQGKDLFDLGTELISLINSYADLPDPVTPRHKRALDVIAQQSLEQALAVAAPGESAYDTTRRAEQLVEYKLGHR